MPVSYELKPVETEDGASSGNIKVPSETTVIGRGELLQIADKKVSRNHAEISTDEDGNLVLTSTHNNPCFYRKHGEGEKSIVSKDQSQVLQVGDIFGLLPDKFFYEVVETQGVSDGSGDKKPVPGSNGATDMKDSGEKAGEKNASEEIKKDENGESGVKDGDKIATVGDKEMALPLEKSRKLPEWMMEDTGSSEEAEPVKSPAKRRGRPAAKGTPAKRGRGRPPTSVTKAAKPKRRKADSSDEDIGLSSEEEEVKPKRKTARHKEPQGPITPSRPRRQASQNRPSYTDDLVLSDAEFSEESVERSPPKKKKDDEDSDFVADEVDQDSGSDWASAKKSKSTPKRKGRQPATRGKRGRPRRYDDSDESMEEDSGSDWEKSRRKPKNTPAKPKPKPRRRKKAPSVSEESESEQSEGSYIPANQKVEAQKKKTRPQCQYGDRCYRKKNKIHCQQLAHPGDEDWIGDNDEDEDQEEQVWDKRTARPHANAAKDSRRPKRQAAERAAASLVDDDDEDYEEEPVEAGNEADDKSEPEEEIAEDQSDEGEKMDEKGSEGEGDVAVPGEEVAA